MAVVLVAAVTFGQCESSITGPTQPTAESRAIPGPALTGSVLPGGSHDGGGGDTEVFKQRTVERKVIFTGMNPCNGDAVRAEGVRYEALTLITRAPSYFESRSKIKDYFKGYAINDPYPPPTRYVGHDEHEHNQVITPTRTEDEIETHEHLIAQGREPDWKMTVYERRRVNILEPWKTKVYYRAKSSCSGSCSLPGGCIDREMSLASFAEADVPSIPVLP